MLSQKGEARVPIQGRDRASRRQVAGPVLVLGCGHPRPTEDQRGDDGCELRHI